MMDRKAIGQQRLREILGENTESIIEGFKKISPDFASYIVEFGYGDLYARKGFDDKSRELAAVACLIGQGVTGMPLKAHLQGMLNVGWAKEEILELLILLIGFRGFPFCIAALQTLEEITSNERN